MRSVSRIIQECFGPPPGFLPIGVVKAEPMEEDDSTTVDRAMAERKAAAGAAAAMAEVEVMGKGKRKGKEKAEAAMMTEEEPLLQVAMTKGLLNRR